MVRKSIYEILEDKVIEPNVAFSRIRYQFDHPLHRCLFSNDNPLTLMELVDNCLFEILPIRGSCIDLRDLFRDIDIELDGDNKTFDDVFRFMEFILCVVDSIPDKDEYMFEEGYQKTVFSKILETIDTILEETNHKIVSDKKGRRIIVSSDAKSELAAELVDESDMSLEILSYNHYSNKGNIAQKKMILKTLGDYIEPKIKGDKGKLSDTISFLLNNFDIRHNNRAGSNLRNYIVEMTDEDLECWYDKTYSCIVAYIIEEDVSSVYKELKRYKK